MKASDLFVQCLETEGIDYIFGVPGEENADFMISLEKSDKIRFILCRHEQGAAFMAEIYGRLTGHTAGCLGTLGPGATNLITGVADSNMDRAPMLGDLPLSCQDQRLAFRVFSLEVARGTWGRFPNLP